MNATQSLNIVVVREGVVAIPKNRKELTSMLDEKNQVVNEALMAIQSFEILRSQEAYSYADVAQVLGVCVRMVQQWVSTGELQTLGLPGTQRLRRVSKDQLRAFIKTSELKQGFKLPKSWQN